MTRLFLVILSFLLLVNPLMGVAVAEQEVKTFADGWTLVNPPKKIDRHDTFEPYFSIDIVSKPIDPQLDPAMHPMAHMLNQYEEIRFHPNPEKIIWADNIQMNGRHKTVNIVDQLLSKYDVSVNNGSFQDALHELKMFMIMIPIYILLGVICTPFFIAMLPATIMYLPSNINASIKDSKLKKQQRIQAEIEKKQRENQFTSIAQRISHLQQILKTLQQTFNPDFYHGSEQQPSKLNNQYHFLPDKGWFDFELSEKKLTFNRDLATVKLFFIFQDKLPSYQAFKEYFKASSYAYTAELELPEDNLSREFTTDQPEGLYVKNCTLDYQEHFEILKLSCQGVRFKNPNESLELRP